MKPGRIGITLSIILHFILIIIFILVKYEFHPPLIEKYFSVKLFEEPVKKVKDLYEPEEITEKQIQPELLDESPAVVPVEKSSDNAINEESSENEKIPGFLFSDELVDSTNTFIRTIDSLLGLNDPARKRFAFDFSSLDLSPKTREDSLVYFLYKLDSVFSKMKFKIGTYGEVMDSQKEIEFKNLNTPNPFGQYGGSDLKTLLINTGLVAASKILRELSSVLKKDEMPLDIELSVEEIEILELVWRIGSGTDLDVYSVLPFNTGHTKTDLTNILERLSAKGVLHRQEGKFLGKRFFFDPKGKLEIIYIPFLSRQELIDMYSIKLIDLKESLLQPNGNNAELREKLRILESRLEVLRK